MPSGVRGPVLGPPCIRQRPLAIAGCRHDLPLRVLAPHRGAFIGSPCGLPFRRSTAFVSLRMGFTYRSSRPPPDIHRPHHGLTAFVDMNVLNDHLLLATGTMLLERLHLVREDLQ